MEIGGCEVLRGSFVHGERGTDVEEDGFADVRGVVDEEFVGDACAAVVCAYEEGWVVEVVHEGDHVFCHGGFGVGGDEGRFG